MWRPKLMQIPTALEALPGRKEAIPVEPEHFVNGRNITGPCPPGLKEIIVGMGCYWGAERLFWQLPGVEVTSVGYGGGHTRNPTYDEVCSGHTGHAELVRIWFDPAVIPLEAILKVFWENHDPTQGMRQGNDVGTQYRSIILCHDDKQQAEAVRSKAAAASDFADPLVTEISPLTEFYPAEPHHQGYYQRNREAPYCQIVIRPKLRKLEIE